MAKDFKVRYSDKDGEHVTEFMDYDSAMKIFRSKKDEKVLKTLWCDVEDWGDPEEDSLEDDGEVYVIHTFTRKVDSVLGIEVITPYYVEDW